MGEILGRQEVSVDPVVDIALKFAVSSASYERDCQSPCSPLVPNELFEKHASRFRRFHIESVPVLPDVIEKCDQHIEVGFHLRISGADEVGHRMEVWQIGSCVGLEHIEKSLRIYG